MPIMIAVTVSDGADDDDEEEEGGDDDDDGCYNLQHHHQNCLPRQLRGRWQALPAHRCEDSA